MPAIAIAISVLLPIEVNIPVLTSGSAVNKEQHPRAEREKGEKYS